MNCFFAIQLLLTMITNMQFSLANQLQLKVTKNWLRIQKEFRSLVAKKFAEFEIVPDLIVTAPDELCNVTFPENVVVQIGEKLSAEQIKEEPEVLWNCDESVLYTLVMQNIDDHDCMNTRSWVVMNSQGCNYFEGYNLFDYKEQDPDHHQNRYRIVFLIYRQPREIDRQDISYYDFTNEATYPDPSFDVQHFADFHSLGDPVAGNFFIVEDVKFKQRLKALIENTPKELRYPKLLWAWENKVKMEAIEKAKRENLTSILAADNIFTKEDIKFKHQSKVLVGTTPKELRYPKLLWAWEKKVKMEAIEKAKRETSIITTNPQS